VEWLSRPLGARGSRFVRERYARVARGFQVLASNRDALSSGLLTVAAWSTGLLGIQLWLVAFGLDLPWYAAIVLQACVAFGTALPSSVAFVGTYHLAIVFGLTTLGLDKTTAVAVAVVGHASSLVPWMAVGAAWVGAAVARKSYAVSRAAETDAHLSSSPP
jgi:hypothetical protein